MLSKNIEKIIEEYFGSDGTFIISNYDIENIGNIAMETKKELLKMINAQREAHNNMS